MLGTTGGLAINIISNDYRWRAVAVAAAAAAVMAAVIRLRRLPTRSLVVRWSARSMLVLAVAAVLLAGLGPAWLAPWAAGAVVLFTAGATLTSIDHIAGFGLLLHASVVGIGVAAIGQGLHWVLGRESQLGVVLFVFGVTMVGSVAAVWMSGDTGALVAVIAVGVMVMIMGVIALNRGAAGPGYAGVAVALAAIIIGVAKLLYGDTGLHWGSISAGILTAGGGLAWLIYSGTAFAVGIVVFAVCLVGVGAAGLARSAVAQPLAVIAGGMAIGSMGVLALLQGNLVLGLAAIGVGVAIGALAIILLARGDVGRRLAAQWARATADPARAAALSAAAGGSPLDSETEGPPPPDRTTG